MTIKLTPKQSALLHLLHSAAVAGATIALYVYHRIPLDVASATLGSLGGFWSAVGVVVKLSGGANAATPPGVAAPVAAAAPTAVSSPPPVDLAAAQVGKVAPLEPGGAPQVSGPALGPEHGAPPA